MTSLNMTNADSVLKTLYPQSKIEDTTYKTRPAYAMLAKFEGFKGRNMQIPIKYGNTQGRSQAFASAQANMTPTKFNDFLITRVKDYSLASVDGETSLATQGDSAAFIEAMTSEIDSAMESLADAHETFVFRDGAGWIGQISSGSNVSTDTITLADINDIVHFEPGMTLVSSGTKTGAVRTQQEVLEGVDRNAGTLTATSAAWDTVATAIAASDYLFVQGDAHNNVGYVKMFGFEGWIPASAPGGSDSFFGVNRSVDTRLAGQRFDASSLGLEEGLIDGASVASREGAQLDCLLLNHIQTRTLKKELGSRIEYSKVPAKNAKGDHASISFRSMVLEGDTGPIDVVACNKCPADVAWGLDKSTWKFNSLGPAVRMLNGDGNRWLRQPTADAYEVRLAFYGQLSCNAPGRNVRITLTVPG